MDRGVSMPNLLEPKASITWYFCLLHGHNPLQTMPLRNFFNAVICTCKASFEWLHIRRAMTQVKNVWAVLQSNWHTSWHMAAELGVLTAVVLGTIWSSSSFTFVYLLTKMYKDSNLYLFITVQCISACTRSHNVNSNPSSLQRKRVSVAHDIRLIVLFVFWRCSDVTLEKYVVWIKVSVKHDQPFLVFHQGLSVWNAHGY